MELPWQPIYTIERSGQPEVTVYGIISVVSGPSQLLSLGEIDYGLWTRSLLKPWQLLSHYCELTNSYPELTDEHLALMMASHSAEEHHLELLNEIMEIGVVSDALLKCPPSYPIDKRAKMREQGQKPKSLYHNCSGKHFGYILALKALGLSAQDYLNPESEQFVILKKILSHLLGRPAESFAETTDGCQLPNYALSSREMSRLYQMLANPEYARQNRRELGDSSADRNLACFSHLGELMRTYPQVIAGADRFDAKLMSHQLAGTETLEIVAKEGADGLLGIGIGACTELPEGAGILIKTSAGYDARHMEAITREIFRQLGIVAPVVATDKASKVRTDHIVSKFHFELPIKQRA
ncbi:MAG TPA: asparaginase [Chroococcales cyanobacterium]